MNNHERAEAHLKAKLFRLAAVGRHEFENRNPMDFEMIASIPKKMPVEINGKNVNLPPFFAATFRDATASTVLPVILSFTPNATGKLSAALGQLAIGCRVSLRERILAFLSIISYLEDVDEMPNGSLRAHIQRITAGGALKDRVAIADEYPQFCERAAKDLPYDTSLEVLAYLKYGDMAAA